MIVYHGSKEKFEDFCFSKMGLNGTLEGKGLYFTDSKRIAEGYGEKGYLYTVLSTGKKQLHPKQVTLSKNQFIKLVIEMDKTTDYLTNWGEVEFEGLQTVVQRAVEGEYEDAESDVDILSSLSTGSGDVETTLRTLYELFGYDSIVLGAEWGGEQTLYIATVKEAYEIKKVEPVKI